MLKSIGLKAFFIGCFLALGGCALHPLQEDATRDPTTAIVKRIRCEARSAIQQKAIDLLNTSLSASAQRLAMMLRDKPSLFARIERRDLTTEKEREFFDRYNGTAIALEFTFDVTEDDQANAQVDFVRLLSGGTVNLGLKATNDHSRQNVRKFLVTDTFETLRHDETICATSSAKRNQNYVYPITGSVGLAEVISTFIDLNEDETLTAKNDAPVFGDQLTFLTVVSASAIPSITLAPVGHAFRLADATLTTQVTRTDRHLLNIGLSRVPPHPDVAGKSSLAPFAGVRPLRTVFAKQRDRTPAIDRAVEAITQQRIDSFYDRLGQTLR